MGLEALQAEWVDGLGTLTLEVREQGWAQIPVRLPGASRLDRGGCQAGRRHLVAQRPKWSEGGFLHGVDEGGLDTYEPHFDVISQEHDVQVYELVAVDVTGAPTNVLERAAGSAKDNRLLPSGFSLDHPVYDTTRVEGQALSDLDFTENAGAGKDRVTYDMMADLPLGSNVDVDVRVWYQAMPPALGQPHVRHPRQHHPGVSRPCSKLKVLRPSWFRSCP